MSSALHGLTHALLPQAPEALDALAVRAAGDLERYTDRLVTDVACSYAGLGHHHPALNEAVQAQVLLRLENLALVGLVQANWALASPGLPPAPGKFFEALNEEVLRRRSGSSPPLSLNRFPLALASEPFVPSWLLG